MSIVVALFHDKRLDAAAMRHDSRLLKIGFLAACCAIAICSCGPLGRPGVETPGTEQQPFGPTGIPAHLRAGNEGQEGERVSPGGNRPNLPADFKITPDEELIFTDPDNPDSVLPELSTLLADPRPQRGGWERSDANARRRAMRENKAVMIWFTDTGRSPMCKALENELFSTAAFIQWADDHLIRLKIESNLAAVPRDDDQSLDQAETLRVDVKNYVAALKKRYRVLGNPTVVMLDAEGRVLTRYRGYKRGEAELLFGKIRHSQSVAARNNGDWRRKMEHRGYREWSDPRGRVTVFARMVRYHEGELVLVEPDGNAMRTRESNLSQADRAWIAEEKSKRGR